MFFDEPHQKKSGLRPKLRLAGANDAREGAGQALDHTSARARLENARAALKNSPSLLDTIDKMGRANDQAIGQHQMAAEIPTDYAANQMDETEQFRGERYHGSQSTPQDNNNWVADRSSAAPLVHPVYVINAIKKWRSLIVATTILGGLIGMGVAAVTPKLYYSSTGILIDPRNFKVVENDINPDVFLSEASLAIVDSQLNIMRSPAVVDKLATQLGLENDLEFNGTKQGLLSPIKAFVQILTGGKTEGTKLGTAIKNLNKKTEVKRQAGTFVVNIGAFSEDAEKAALIANTYAEIYLAERASDRAGTADRASSAMQARLPELKKQVEAAEIKVANFKAENDLFDAQGRLIDDEEILRINDQLTAARSNTITLNSRADSAKSVTVDGLIAGSLPEEVNSNALNSLRTQYASVKQRYDGLQAKLGPMHPDLKQAEKESASLRAGIESEIQRVRNSIQTELRRAVQTEQALAVRLAEMKAKLAQAGDALVKLRELEREAGSARTVYEQFLLRAQETGEQGTIDSTNVKRTNIAKPATESTGLSRKLIALGGLLGGFMLGLGLTILIGILDALKVQYGGSFGTARPVDPQPDPRPSRPKRTLRGTFQSAETQIRPTTMRSDYAGSNLTTAQDQARPVQVSEQNLVQPAPPSQAAAPLVQAPQYAPMAQPVQAPVYAQPQMMPMPVYAQPQPMLMPQPHYPWFAPQQVMMPQMVMPQMMMPQPMWQQPQQMAPVPMPQAATPAPANPVSEPAPVHVIRAKPLPQNAQLSDIQTSLSDMKAELLTLARQRRHG